MSPYAPKHLLSYRCAQFSLGVISRESIHAA